jgi:hypothetical protein
VTPGPGGAAGVDQLLADQDGRSQVECLTSLKGGEQFVQILQDSGAIVHQPTKPGQHVGMLPVGGCPRRHAIGSPELVPFGEGREARSQHE